MTIILGLESSCDETAAALVDSDRRILAHRVAGQEAEHSPFGGVVPEIAARAHVDRLAPLVAGVLADADVSLADVDAIAATAGPGLIGGVMVGLVTGKALAHAANKPLIAVNHLEGHALSPRLVDPDLAFPYLLLLVSGGHCQLLLVKGVGDFRRLATTIDDAAGEAFDKVGRLLGLPYPGGPHIDRLAREGNPDAIRFPRALTLPKDQAEHAYDFSFSGLKTAVARWVEAKQDAGEEIPLHDVAASFAAAVADVLTAKTIRACQFHGVDTLVIGGGFSANSQLRAMAAERCAAAGIELRIPPIRYCTDNGAMIAALGSALVRAGVGPSSLDIPVDSSMPLTITHV